MPAFDVNHVLLQDMARSVLEVRKEPLLGTNHLDAASLELRSRPVCNWNSSKTSADAEVVVLLRQCPSGSAPFPLQHYLETKIGTDICASKVRVVPPSKSCLKRA
jgi:hypothetical protein